MSNEVPSYTVVLADKRPWDLSVNLAIVQVPVTFDGRTAAPHRAVKTLAFEDIGADGLIDPSLSLPHQQAQQLFNCLWQMGFRPSDGTGNSGHIEAIKNHLNDMRRLVFNGERDGAK